MRTRRAPDSDAQATLGPCQLGSPDAPAVVEVGGDISDSANGIPTLRRIDLDRRVEKWAAQAAEQRCPLKDSISGSENRIGFGRLLKKLDSVRRIVAARHHPLSYQIEPNFV